MPSAQQLAQQALQSRDHARAIRLMLDALSSASPAAAPFIVTQLQLTRQQLLRRPSPQGKPIVLLVGPDSGLKAADSLTQARQALAGWCEVRAVEPSALEKAGAWWTWSTQSRVDAVLLLADPDDAWRCALAARAIWGAVVWLATARPAVSPLDTLVDARLKGVDAASLKRHWQQRPDRPDLWPSPALHQAANHLLRGQESLEPARLLQRLLAPAPLGIRVDPVLPAKARVTSSVAAPAPAVAAPPAVVAATNPRPPARRPATPSAGPERDPLAVKDGRVQLSSLELGQAAPQGLTLRTQTALRALAGLHEGFHAHLRQSGIDLAAACHDTLGTWRVVDAAWISDAQLRLRIEPGAGSTPEAAELMLLQCAPRTAEPRIVARQMLDNEAGHVVDVTLAHVFQPLALLANDDQGRVTDAAVWPFPSLLRGAPHHAELWQLGDTAPGFDAALRAGGQLLRELLGPPWLGGALSLSRIEVDLRRANGSERLLSPPVRQWLSDVMGLPVLEIAESATQQTAATREHLALRCAACEPAIAAGRSLAVQRSQGDRLRLRLAAESLPSLSLLCTRRLELADDTFGAGSHALVHAVSARPLALISMPAPDESLLKAQAPDDALDFPLLLGSSGDTPARAVRVALPMAVYLREPVAPHPAQLLAPTSLDADGPLVMAEPGTGSSVSAIVLLDEAGDPAPLLESLARQSLGSALQLVAVTTGRVSPALRAQLQTLFPGRHVVQEDAPSAPSARWNAAVDAARGTHALLVRPQLLLHDARTLHTLLAIASLPGVAAASCVQIREVAFKKGTEVRYASGGYFPGHIDLTGRAALVLEEPVSSVAFGRGSWPVVALSSRLALVDRAVWSSLGGYDPVRFPAEGADVDWCLRARAAGHQLLCTGAVTALVGDGARSREFSDLHAWQLLPLERWHHVIAGSASIRTLTS